MLDEGVRSAFGHLGIDLRAVAYGEWEAPAASQLVALMEAGLVEPAPVWCGDFRRLPAERFRGTVDAIVAGFPCQDLSIAGRRAGLDGKRSGLFFSVVDFADACGAWCLVLENVAGIATATASVVDEEEGDLEERAVARVLGELADRGWDAEWITLSASDVGASHGRERWFCVAWREPLADTDDGRLARICRYGQGGTAERLNELADASSARLPKRIGGGQLRDGAPEPDARPDPQLHGDALFAPGPADPRWPGILAERPWLAPATEPGVRLLVDGVALLVDESRNHQLRQVGNGVVPLQAAVAVVVLARRAGLLKG